MQKFFSLALIFLLIFPVVLNACASLPQSVDLPPISQGDWTTADLRWIGRGDASDPHFDLIAAYTRRTVDELQIRLDFLSPPESQEMDIFLALDNAPGGETRLPVGAQADIRWNALFAFPAGAEPIATTSDGNSQASGAAYLSVGENFDGLTLHLSKPYLVPGISLQVFITIAGSNQVVDFTPPLALQAESPMPAHLLLAFWDTLPAATPAQAMRRWNGAHTGPLGQRHGLLQLLRAADRYSIPVVLLDLKTPSSLAALELLEGLALLQSLDSRELLLIPDTVFGDPLTTDYSLIHSRHAGELYGLSPSPFIFAPLTETIPDGYQGAFYSTEDTLILPATGGRLIPLPEPLHPHQDLTPNQSVQVDRSGLTLETKRTLINTALTGDAARLAVFGGSLPASLWADSSIAMGAFAYIANHPWIKPLDQKDLLSIPLTRASQRQKSLSCSDLLCSPMVLPFVPYTRAEQPIPSGMTSVEMRQLIRTMLAESPPGAATDLAWQMYLNLTVPTPNPYRQALQANYLGQVGHLLYIARWADRPAAISGCTLDLDFDGITDCVLASDRFIATFKTDDGRLLFAGSLQDGEFIQWIGPASQFQVGGSDSSQWQIRRGTDSDPNEIPGAFASESTLLPGIATTVQSDSISFTAPDEFEKTYRLMPNGFELFVKSARPIRTHLPAALAPQSAWVPGGLQRYEINTGAGSNTHLLALIGGPQLAVEIRADHVNVHAASNSFSWMGSPENPDQAYPPGHFLPFPLAVFEIESANAVQVVMLQK